MGLSPGLLRDIRLAMGLSPGLLRDIRAFKPDIIHLSAPDLLGASALSLARRLNVPVVASLHTHFDSYLDYYGLGWLTPFVQGRLRAFYDACDYVLAPTRSIAEQTRKDAPSARVHVWPRGVDAKLFNPTRRSLPWRRAHGFADDRPVVVFLGRIVMEKGLATFVETIGQLERACGPVQVLVIGDGPALPWFRDKLPGAVFTGFLAGEALATAIASGDIFLNPSTTETFGNVNLEAMASGLALVCADAPNSRTLVSDGQSGLLCRPHDPQAFREAIMELLSDPARRSALACEAHRQSGAYRWSQILDQVVDVYREALTPPRIRRRAETMHGQFEPAVQRLREPLYGAFANLTPLPSD